jgi:hypothetical protein
MSDTMDEQQKIVKVISKKMGYMRKRRTAGRMRAKGFAPRVIKEQLWSRL